MGNMGKSTHRELACLSLCLALAPEGRGGVIHILFQGSVAPRVSKKNNSTMPSMIPTHVRHVEGKHIFLPPMILLAGLFLSRPNHDQRISTHNGIIYLLSIKTTHGRPGAHSVQALWGPCSLLTSFIAGAFQIR